jgi:hypothetical protein
MESTKVSFLMEKQQTFSMETGDYTSVHAYKHERFVIQSSFIRKEEVSQIAVVIECSAVECQPAVNGTEVMTDS